MLSMSLDRLAQVNDRILLSTLHATWSPNRVMTVLSIDLLCLLLLLMVLLVISSVRVGIQLIKSGHFLIDWTTTSSLHVSLL